MEQNYCPYCMLPVDEIGQCSSCGRWSGGYEPLPHHLPPGTVLNGRYHLGGALGSGGFAITYIGLDGKLGNRVAIKEYFPIDQAIRNSAETCEVTLYSGVTREGFDAGRAGFLHEARTLAKMEKQSVVVGVRDYFEENGTAYLVLEYVEGTTLEALATQGGGRITPDKLLFDLKPLFAALSELHGLGLIHRDITPDNVMLEGERVRLIDFGCARGVIGSTQALTATLKRGYAPIEQYGGYGQGPWTDIYALCATIYRCITGVVPASALERITTDELVPPRKMGIRISKEQESALMRGLRLKPARRFRTILQLEKALYGSAGPINQCSWQTNGKKPIPRSGTPGKERGMGYSEVKRQGDAILRDVEDCALLVGPEDAGVVVDEVVAGIAGMETSVTALLTAAAGIRESKFVTLFMGTFNNGKSTTINSLLGSRRLPVAVTEATAVVSKVSYGEDEDTVIIFYEDDREPRSISSQQFLEEFVLTPEEKGLLHKQSGKALDRFEGIGYTQLYSTDSLFRDGVELVDSPGLGASPQTERRTRGFMDKANAVIYLLNATALFNKDEREIIGRLFVRPSQVPQNVFFLVNKINMVDEYDTQDVYVEVESTLRDVFTRDGVCDEELMRHRIFYVDSRGALLARQRGETKVSKYVKAFFDFQDALEAFLTSDEKVLATYRPSLVGMAFAYSGARENVGRARMTLREKPDEQRARADECAKKLNELRRDVDKMARELQQTRDIVTMKVMNSLRDFLSKDLPNAWPEAAEEFDGEFGIAEMVKLALPLSEEKKQEILSPMKNFIERFVADQTEVWADSIEGLIEDDMNSMQQELNAQGDEFRLDLVEIVGQFSGEHDVEWTGKPNPVQLALSLIQGDVSEAVKNASGGNFTWGEFVARYLKQGLINLIVFSVFGGGLPGLIAAIIIEVGQIWLGEEAQAQRIIEGLAQKVFPKIKDEVLKRQDYIEHSIASRFHEMESIVTSTSLGEIDDELRRQEAIMRKLELAEDEMKHELERQDKVIDALFKRVSHTYGLLYEEQPTTEEILAIASERKVGA